MRLQMGVEAFRKAINQQFSDNSGSLPRAACGAHGRSKSDVPLRIERNIGVENPPHSCWSAHRFDPVAEAAEFPDHSPSALLS